MLPVAFLFLYCLSLRGKDEVEHQFDFDGHAHLSNQSIYSFIVPAATAITTGGFGFKVSDLPAISS